MRVAAGCTLARQVGGEEGAPVEDAADYGRKLARQTSRAGRPGTMEEQISTGGCAARAGWRAGRLHARQVVHLDPDPCQPAQCARSLRPAQETPDPDDDPTREWRQWRAAKRKKAEE